MVNYNKRVWKQEMLLKRCFLKAAIKAVTCYSTSHEKLSLKAVLKKVFNELAGNIFVPIDV